MTDLSKPQADLLRRVPGDGTVRGRWIDGAELLSLLPENHATTQGVHQTAASLVRRGYLMKSKIAGHGVEYRITAKGVEWLRATDSPRCVEWLRATDSPGWQRGGLSR